MEVKAAKYANIIIDISHEKLDRTFQYVIPGNLSGRVEIGSCVSVPFGAGNHLRKGYCIGLTDRAEYAPEKLKEIAAVEEKSVQAEDRYIRLAAWMREQYGSTMITALKTVLPVKRKIKQAEKKSCRLLLPRPEAEVFLEECVRKHYAAKARLVQELLKVYELPMTLVTGKLHVPLPTLKTMEQRGVIKITVESAYRNPVKLSGGFSDKRMERYGKRKMLSDEQYEAAAAILADFDAGKRTTCLLHGITGSGKTEVYLALIEEMIKRGRQAIVLIPEIALTYQTLIRFYACFGERVSVMNSTLSMGEKYDQWERAKQGEIDVIIGPRSALFTPFPRLGLILIDEEHENTYKSETMPKYHARETAEKIASMEDALVVLGSATPSLEAYYRAKQGIYMLYELTKRQAGGELPAVHTVDLRKELKEGNRSVFSRRLHGLMEDRLGKKEQVILFLNRRGYAGFVSCRACGHVMKCPHCDVSLSEHKGGRLVCHYCGYEQPAVKTCPSCGSKYILGFRAGTQQIEEAVLREFPGTRVLRMDADTTRTKDSYEEILGAFANGEADILVGTQMIVKGHDFPNVTLVGILAADMSLHVGDYRSGERTFQLLTQAAGRAGRSGKSGEVVIQTYDPDHYSIVYAAKQDYKGFYEEEILYRKMLAYPPAAHMLAILTAARTEKEGLALAGEIATLVRNMEGGSREGRAYAENRLYVIGPAPASVGKINDVYRFMLYVKHGEYGRLVEVKNRVEAFLEEREEKADKESETVGNDVEKKVGKKAEKKERVQRGKETVQFDFDPMSAY